MQEADYQFNLPQLNYNKHAQLGCLIDSQPGSMRKQLEMGGSPVRMAVGGWGNSGGSINIEFDRSVI